MPIETDKYSAEYSGFKCKHPEPCVDKEIIKNKRMRCVPTRTELCSRHFQIISLENYQSKCDH